MSVVFSYNDYRTPADIPNSFPPCPTVVNQISTSSIFLTVDATPIITPIFNPATTPTITQMITSTITQKITPTTTSSITSTSATPSVLYTLEVPMYSPIPTVCQDEIEPRGKKKT